MKYGIGSDYNFVWDETKSEEYNVRQLDLETTRALFKQPKMTFDLKKGMFEMGIGGLNFADSLFFRDMQIPYIKLIPQDIDSHIM